MKPSTKRALWDLAAFAGGWIASDLLVTGFSLTAKSTSDLVRRANAGAAIVGAATPAVAYLAFRASEPGGLFASGMGASSAWWGFRLKRSEGA